MNNSEKERLQAKIDELQAELDSLKEWKPWKGGPDDEICYIDSFGFVDWGYSSSSLAEELYESGNYYHPDNRESLEKLASMDKFAALVRQYGFGNGAITHYSPARRWVINHFEEGYKPDKTFSDSSRVGGMFFGTKEQAQQCLEWVQEKMGDE